MALTTKYRCALSIFIVGLVLSGVTAFPLAWELRVLTQGIGINSSAPPEAHSGFSFWLATVDQGKDCTRLMPFTRGWPTARIGWHLRIS
jgi:hypothetical protein